mgnify:CR=1 FL=1
MHQISVIVPIYNAELYLGKCIESLINQDYTALQIILVDDGSTDNSFAIMKEYEEKYENVELFHFDEKSGAAGKPRNKGMQVENTCILLFILRIY